MPPSHYLGQGLRLAWRVGHFQTHEEAALYMHSISMDNIWLWAGVDQASRCTSGALDIYHAAAVKPSAHLLRLSQALEYSACRSNGSLHERDIDI